jgi:predicted TIM-barrel fold metal-dependent hydrolase
MDEQGVDVSVLYPGVAGVAGEALGRIADPALEVECVRAYNDWLIDEWAAASPRLVPLCVVPLHPVDAAVAELERAVGKGARGLVYPALPMFVRDVPEISPDEHRPLWEACAALGIPVSFHSGVADQIVAPPPAGASPRYADALATVNRPISSALFVAHLLLSQILAPHPRLRAVFPENSVAWMGFALETMDYLVKVDRLNVDTYDRMPSEVFAGQCYVVGSYERLDRCSTDLVPTTNVLWSSAYPGPSTTWPTTPRTVAESLAGTPAEDRSRVLWDNAASLYGLADVPLAVGAQAV